MADMAFPNRIISAADLRRDYIERLDEAQNGIERALESEHHTLLSFAKRSSKSNTSPSGIEKAGDELRGCLAPKTLRLRKSLQDTTSFPSDINQNIENYIGALEGSIQQIEAAFLGVHLTGNSIEKNIRKCQQNIEKAWKLLDPCLAPSIMSSGTLTAQHTGGPVGEGRFEQPNAPPLRIESPKPQTRDPEETFNSEAPPENETGSGSDAAAWTKLLGPSRTILKYIGAATPLVPVVGQFIQCGVDVGNAIIDMLDGSTQNTQAVQRLVKRVTRLSSMVDVFKDEKRSYCSTGSGTQHLEEFRRLCGPVHTGIQKLRSQNSVGKLIFADDNTGTIEDLNGKIDDALEQLDFYLRLNADHMLNDLGEARLVALLGDGDYGNKGYEDEDGLCLEGTRNEVLHGLDAWADDPSAAKVLLLKGQAGRGKSTIAKTVARRYVTRPGKGASTAIFFFRRGEKGLNERPIRALARQLVRKGDSRLRNVILQAIQDNQDVASSIPEEQFRVLLVEPLKKMESNPPPVMLVIDALDECGEEAYSSSLLRIIAKYSPSLPPTVKILLTGRPEHDIVPHFERFMENGRMEDLDTVDTDVVEKDLQAFFEARLSSIGRLRGLDSGWQGAGTINQLIDLAQGLFQWATTAIEFIAPAPETRLQKLLRSKSSVVGLPALYSQILVDAFPEDSEVDEELIQHVLGLLVVAPGSLSLTILAYLRDQSLDPHQLVDAAPEIRDEILNRLRSFLLVPASPDEPIQFLHTSVRDFLVNRKQCRDHRFVIDIEQHHRRLTMTSFERMRRDFEAFNVDDICGSSQTSAEVRDAFKASVSPGLVYCARSWSAHISQVPHDEANAAYLGLLDEFCHTNLVHWMEILSLAEAAREIIPMAQQGKDWISHHKAYSETYNLLNDAHRLCRQSFQIIATRPYHISRSVLLHCPRETAFRHVYKLGDGTPHIMRGHVHNNWPSQVWMKIVGAVVFSAAFSPDGETIASGSSDNTIRLWNVKDGTQFGAPLTGHTSTVYAVAFSPDGKTIASGSYDNTIRLWNVKDGTQFGAPLTGHTSTVYAVAFSPDGKTIASGSYDNTIRLWNVKDGTQLGAPLTGHTDAVYAVAFSPDGKTIASGSSDNTIRLWNAKDGTQLGAPLTGHTDAVNAVAFSPDGKTIVSGSSDNTIRLWNVKDGTQLGAPLTGHTSTVYAVAFSPDGKTIASGSYDNTIRLWNVKDGTQLGAPLTGHTDAVYAVAFSPDGKTIVSGSSDNTIRLWNVKDGTQLGAPLTGHTSTVYAVAFSPDSKTIASGSNDNTIRLWNVKDGTQLGAPLTGHTSTVNAVAFSPDGKTIASGSSDNTIRLWNAKDGTQLGAPLTGHTDAVNAVAFSPDGKTIASWSYDWTVRLWCIENGTQIEQAASVRDLPSFQHAPKALVTFNPRNIQLHGSGSSGDLEGWALRDGIRWFWLPREWYVDSYGRGHRGVSLSNNLLVIHHPHIHILDVSDVLH